MGCNSDYMHAKDSEIELSRIYCLLEELQTGKKIDRHHWEGYHPAAYDHHITKFIMDREVENLCSILQKTDVSKYSLELQMWWRDHQAADKARIEREILEKEKTEARKSAIEKLTPYERGLLGLD